MKKGTGQVPTGISLVSELEEEMSLFFKVYSLS